MFVFGLLLFFCSNINGGEATILEVSMEFYVCQGLVDVFVFGFTNLYLVLIFVNLFLPEWQ